MSEGCQHRAARPVRRRSALQLASIHMPNPTDVLEPLFEVFERATERLAEGRRTRWHAALYGPKPRERGRPSEALVRLALGEVSLDDFLLLKIERALTPLRKLLDEDDIAIPRVLLREQCDSAPVLTSLVHRIKHFIEAERRSLGPSPTKNERSSK